MKVKIIALFIVILMVSGAGYRLYTRYFAEGVSEPAVPIPVRVMTVRETDVVKSLAYEGRITASVLEKVAFKATARLAAFEGQVGDTLPEGHVLAVLDDEDLLLALEGANNQYEGAAANYRQALAGTGKEDLAMASIGVAKAEAAVLYLEDKFMDMEELFDQGMVSRAELDGMKLEMDLASKDLLLAQENLNKAEEGTDDELIKAAYAQMKLAAVNVKAQEDLLEDSRYALPGERVLISRFYEIGELVPAGYPVAVLRSLDQQVVIGVGARDLERVHIGQKVWVSARSGEGLGRVSRISEVPDEHHFLYEVAVELEESTYLIGDIALCNLDLGVEKVIALPLAAVMNDGIDYVYVVEDGMAMIQQVTILEAMEDQVSVTGLETGQKVIISNLNRLQPTSAVRTEDAHD